MSLDAGRLRHRVVIERNTPAQDTTTGEMVDYWSEYTTVWASIEPMSAKEFIAAQAVQSEVTGKIVMRFRADITPDMRVNHNGRVYNIVGIIPDPDSGLEWMTLPVSDWVNVRGL